MTSNRTLIGCFFVLVVVVALLAASVGSGIDDGEKAKTPAAEAMAPDFTLPTHDGKRLTFSRLRGQRGAVLVFFATWCVQCMEEVPELMEFVEFARDKSVLVYGVNYMQTPRVVHEFVAEREVNYRILLDSEGAVADAFGVQGFPTIVAVDADGVIRERLSSPPPHEEWQSFVDELTAPLAKAPPLTPKPAKPAKPAEATAPNKPTTAPKPTTSTKQVDPSPPAEAKAAPPRP